tara:strand:+ start:3048 stop:4151 length:1104 start_codon:yes stop_codon:yes gene_type:complete
LIKLSQASITNKEINEVNKVLKNQYLGMGKNVFDFEKKLSVFLNREVVCVNTGTSALQLALESLRLPKGSEVLVPTITYVASYQAITASGLKPIPCDINLNNLIIDLDDSQKRITKKTKCIMPVFFAGEPGDVKKIYKFAKKNNLRIVEDAAHAFGSKYKNKLIGSFGDITCFSFDGIKNITAGEGGCIVTNDKKSLNYIKNARLLGVEGDTDKRKSGERSFNFQVNYQGWRYHMSNINAAIGSVQLKRSQSIFEKRKILARYYCKILKDSNKIDLLQIDYENIVPHIFVIILKSNINRDTLRKKLLYYDIETGVHYKPNNRLNFFKTKNNFKNTNILEKNILTLPLHVNLTKKDIIKVTSTLLKLL